MWNDEDQADEVLAMVVRTGCNSTIGNMLRHALRPSNFLSATDSLVRVRHCFAIRHDIDKSDCFCTYLVGPVEPA